MKQHPITRRVFALTSIAFTALALSSFTTVSAAQPQLLKPDGKAADMKKPVKVFILMGQSNMVGMGDINGGGGTWHEGLQKLELSVYEGAYSPTADYDKLTPVSTTALEAKGEWKAPDSSPKERTCVLRGQIQMKPGEYDFSPGYAGASLNIMVIDGTEVYRQEANKKPLVKTFTFEEGKAYPLKVTYLTPEIMNAGWYSRPDSPGTLNTLVKRQKKYPFLLDDAGEWSSRKDVYYYDARNKKGSSLSALSNGDSVGPELGFGHVMGQLLDEPVLVLKSCIGNRGLGWDLLPPGSERFEVDGMIYAGYKDTPNSWAKGTEPKPIDWYAGKQYDEDVANAKAALADIAKIYPDYQGQGFEIAGFAWWQGHKDQMSSVYASRYEQNLVNLIKSLRKDYNAPNARFVLAVGCGNPGRTGLGLQVAEAQLAMNDAKKHPEFSGNVKCVDSRDFWREVAVSPRDQGHHYNRNAETYMEVGLSLGQAMADISPIQNKTIQ